MIIKSIVWAAVLFTVFILYACQASKTTTGKTTALPPPQTTAKQTVTHPPQSMAPQPEPAGYPAGDTIDWTTVPESYRPAPYLEGTRQLPGEKLGLMGPIVAEGGKGKNAYIVIYDAAGVLIGGLLKKEAARDPEKLRILLERALKRSEHQNHFALTKMRRNGALDK